MSENNDKAPETVSNPVKLQPKTTAPHDPKKLKKLHAEADKAVSSPDTGVVMSLPEEAAKMRRLRKSQLGLRTDSDNFPIANLDNCMRLLADPDLATFSPWLDTFSNILRESSGDPWSDAMTLEIQQRLQSSYDMPKVPRGTVDDAIRLAGSRNRRDPAAEWARACAAKWDGIQRIARFLDDIFACGQSDYTAACSTILWRSLAARAIHPGCKVDTMIVLESPQGAGKSSVCGAMVPPGWFGVINRSPDDPKFIVELQGKLVIELAELNALSRADIRKIKSVLSTESDYMLLPYAHHATDLPRRCVFIGTTNRSDYLVDETGNRRFLPIACGRMDPRSDLVERVTAIRDQLMGESAQDILAGKSWHDFPADAAQAAQDERMEPDSWVEIMAAWSDARHGFISTIFGEDRRCYMTHEIMEHALGIETGRQSKADQMRLSSVLRRTGTWEKSRINRDRVWYRI